MEHSSDLRFLQEKIKELRSALFFSQSTSLLRILTSIVSVLKVDDLGQMWFFVPRPRQALHEFEREFPVKLEFFRKGKPFFLHITGKAFIITDPEEINNLVEEEVREQAKGLLVLIKVKIGNADYFESPSPETVGWWGEFRTGLMGWLFNNRPGYRPYHVDTHLALSSI